MFFLVPSGYDFFKIVPLRDFQKVLFGSNFPYVGVNLPKTQKSRLTFGFELTKQRCPLQKSVGNRIFRRLLRAKRVLELVNP